MANQNKQLEALKAENEALAAKVEAQEVKLKDQSAERADAEAVESVSTDAFRRRLYWARAKKYRIANFVRERKTAGNIDQREISIQFEEHIFTAHTKEDADYIEGHKGYGVECWRVKDMAEARALTEKQELERGLARQKPITTAVMDDVDSPKEREKMAAKAVASE